MDRRGTECSPRTVRTSTPRRSMPSTSQMPPSTVSRRHCREPQASATLVGA